MAITMDMVMGKIKNDNCNTYAGIHDTGISIYTKICLIFNYDRQHKFKKLQIIV